jgi:hypothetical protein
VLGITSSVAREGLSRGGGGDRNKNVITLLFGETGGRSQGILEGEISLYS